MFILPVGNIVLRRNGHHSKADRVSRCGSKMSLSRVFLAVDNTRNIQKSDVIDTKTLQKYTANNITSLEIAWWTSKTVVAKKPRQHFDAIKILTKSSLCLVFKIVVVAYTNRVSYKNNNGIEQRSLRPKQWAYNYWLNKIANKVPCT